jgi:phage terminase large subunit
VQFLRSFREIVVHERCQNVAREMRLYSYKVDRMTGDVLPQIVDADNHCIDAIRYALAPMIRKTQAGGFIAL